MDFYREKAEKELGENETRKAQSLEQFRDWLNKQSHIKNCRQDDIYLLRFLRARKYSFSNAIQTLENAIASIKIFPQYFNNLDIKDPILEQLLEIGYFLIMPNRTKNGERILIIRPQVLDFKKVFGYDVVRMHSLATLCTLEEDETQISGIKFIVDFTNLSLEHFGLVSITDYGNIIEIIKHALPLRIKGLYLINVPEFASSILKIIISFFNKKLKDRIKFFKTFDELRSEFDIDLLPTEYGGKTSISETVNFMKEFFLKLRLDILRLLEIDIELENLPKFTLNFTEIDMGIEGNFRKMEID